MNENTGMGSMGLPYEYTVKKRETTGLKILRVLLCVAYVLWTLGNVAVVLLFKSLLVLMILVWVCGLWLMIVWTWRRTFVEFEFSFFGGELTVSRILGSRSRRRLLTVEIRELSYVLPYDDEHLPVIEKFRPEKKAYAVSALDAPDLYVLLWKDKNDVKHMLCMETNERAIKNLKYHNAFAFRK